jgi:hypothetical protein
VKSKHPFRTADLQRRGGGDARPRRGRPGPARRARGRARTHGRRIAQRALLHRPQNATPTILAREQRRTLSRAVPSASSGTRSRGTVRTTSPAEPRKRLVGAGFGCGRLERTATVPRLARRRRGRSCSVLTYRRSEPQISAREGFVGCALVGAAIERRGHLAGRLSKRDAGRLDGRRSATELDA